MFKFIKVSIIALLMTSLVGCSDKNEETKGTQGEALGSTKKEVVKTETQSIEDSENKLGVGILEDGQHATDGLVIHEITPQASGHYIVTGSNMFGPVIGVLDENLEWVIEPNIEIFDVTTFSDGLIGVAIGDTRPIRAGTDEGNNKLWGFVNEDGEWAIKPIYREIGEFSEGLAYVLTIEEDRDDLSNARGIIIDKEGKEVADVLPKAMYTEYEDIESYAVSPKFFNGTIDISIHSESNPHLVVDKEGTIFEFPDDVMDYSLNGYDVYQVTQESELKSNIYKTDLQLNNTNSIPVNIKGFDESYLTFHHSNFFMKNKLFEIQSASDSQTQLGLYNVDGAKVVEYTANSTDDFNLISEGDDWVLYYSPEVKFNNPNENDYDEAQTIVYIDSKGDSQEFILKYNWKLAEYKDRYWEEGNEYAVLKTFDGKTLLGEDFKIPMNEIEPSDGQSIASVQYRENSESVDLLPGLVDLETGKLITLEQFYVTYLDEN